MLKNSRKFRAGIVAGLTVAQLIAGSCALFAQTTDAGSAPAANERSTDDEPDKGSDETAKPPSFIRSGKEPPPGFESLAEMQSTEADVYFAGEYLLSTFVQYDLNTVELLNPAEVAEAIPRALDATLIESALTGPLPKATELACSQRATNNCGVLEPAIAGVIFNEDRFRLDIFVNPLQLAIQPVHLSRYLPPSNAGFSTLHDINLNAAGDKQNDNFSLSAVSLFAKFQSRVRARYGVTDDGATLDELSWQHDAPDWEYEVGSFKSFGRSVAFVNEQDLVGFRVGSSINTRVDLDTAQANPIFLFLDQRSRVDIFRDDQLVDSRYYEAGNQQLNTARLPDGAYDIRVRTQDRDGREKEQTYFFVRSAMLPPLGEPHYYAEAGTIARTIDNTLPEIDGGAWLRTGTSRRLRDDLGVEAELLHAGGTTLLEGGAFWFGPGWQVQGNLMASDDGDTGVALRGSVRRGNVSFSVDFRRVTSDQAPPLLGEFDLIPDSFTQGIATLSLPVWEGQFFARASLDRRRQLGRSEAFGISYFRPLLRRGGYTADLNFDSSIEDSDKWVRIGVTFRWRRDRHYTSIEPQIRSSFGDEDGTDLLLDGRWTYDQHSPTFGDVSSGVFAIKDQEREILGGRVVSESAYGFNDFSIQHTDGGSVSGMGYSLNSRFSVVTKDRAAAWGGKRSELSAIVVDVAGDVPDAEFEVIVDNRVAGFAKPGRRSVVPLRPYESYDVRLNAIGDTILGFDQGTSSVTLYPGNVQTLNFEAEEIIVIVSQALGANGEAIANARFENVEGYGLTDQNGWFQIETTHRFPLRLRTRSGDICEMALPDFDAAQGLAVLEPLTCLPIPEQP